MAGCFQASERTFLSLKIRQRSLSVCLSNKMLQSFSEWIRVFKLLLNGIEGCPIHTNRFYRKICVFYRKTGSLLVKMDIYYREWEWFNSPEVSKLMTCIPPLVPIGFRWTWIESSGFHRSDRFSDDERKSCLGFTVGPKIAFHQSPMKCFHQNDR